MWVRRESTTVKQLLPKVPSTSNIFTRSKFGGAGQCDGLEGYLEQAGGNKTKEFKKGLVGNNVPPDVLPAIEKGFNEASQEGTLTGHRVQGVRMTVLDARTYSADSNGIAFRLASIMDFGQDFESANEFVLEPVLKVDFKVPMVFHGSIMSALSKHRGIINNTGSHGDFGFISAEVPPSQMFGYSTELRSMTQGKGEYYMEYLENLGFPDLSQLIKTYQEKVRAGL